MNFKLNNSKLINLPIIINKYYLFFIKFVKFVIISELIIFFFFELELINEL